MSIFNIIIVGTGGQGIVLASRIITHVAFEEGLDVKESELHGMAQRGGSVVGHIRFGEKVYSTTIPNGQADIIVALEEMESIRYLQYLKPNGVIILNKKRITPAMFDESKYPQGIEDTLKEKGYNVYSLEAEKIAKELGNVKIENSVILGYLSAFLKFNEETWIEVIKNSVPPKTIELNIKAFQEGRRLGRENAILERGVRDTQKGEASRTSASKA